MKNPTLQPLLDQVELVYQSEKQIAVYLRELLMNSPDDSKLNSILRDVVENKTQCERLEGLIEIIKANLHRKLSTSETQKYKEYCAELLHRFKQKHALHSYENTKKLAEPNQIRDIEEILKAVQPEVLYE